MMNQFLFPRRPADGRRKVPAKLLLILLGLTVLYSPAVQGQQPPPAGQASWYGEEHRGKLMANGKPFDPNQMTAASWFYPLGTQVRVTLVDPSRPAGSRRSILVTITDRGPAKRLSSSGRIIDLSHAAFKALASPELGLVQVELQPMPQG